MERAHSKTYLSSIRITRQEDFQTATIFVASYTSAQETCKLKAPSQTHLDFCSSQGETSLTSLWWSNQASPNGNSSERFWWFLWFPRSWGHYQSIEVSWPSLIAPFATGRLEYKSLRQEIQDSVWSLRRVWEKVYVTSIQSRIHAENAFPNPGRRVLSFHWTSNWSSGRSVWRRLCSKSQERHQSLP